MTPPSSSLALDPQAAAHSLVLAESAARNVLDLRGDPPPGGLHLALFAADGDGSTPADPSDSGAVISFMDGRLLAEHGSDGTTAVRGQVGFSSRDICRLKAFECVHAGVDAYRAIIERRKFDGATRSYGSHRFHQILPAGGSATMIAAASGWRGDQDYLAAMMVPATLHSVLLEYGVLPRELIVSSTFVLSSGAWEYPSA